MECEASTSYQTVTRLQLSLDQLTILSGQFLGEVKNLITVFRQEIYYTIAKVCQGTAFGEV